MERVIHLIIEEINDNLFPLSSIDKEELKQVLTKHLLPKPILSKLEKIPDHDFDIKHIKAKVNDVIHFLNIAYRI